MPAKDESILPAPETSGLAPLAVPIPEAGRLLSVSARTAWALAVEGRLKSFKIGTRKLVSIKEIERFIADATAAAETSGK